MDIAPRTTNYQVDDHSWLGSAHGVDSTETITLDLSAGGFVSGTHYPNGYIPSGTKLAKITASGKYGLYDDAAVDGRQTLVGFLLGGVPVPSGATSLGAAMYTHGKVREANLPFTVDAAGKTDVTGRIRFI